LQLPLPLGHHPAYFPLSSFYVQQQQRQTFLSFCRSACWTLTDIDCPFIKEIYKPCQSRPSTTGKPCLASLQSHPLIVPSCSLCSPVSSSPLPFSTDWLFNIVSSSSNQPKHHHPAQRYIASYIKGIITDQCLTTIPSTPSMLTTLCNRETPSKPAHTFTSHHGLPTPSQSAMAHARIEPFIASRNGGGDPVTALAYRTETTSSGVDERMGSVQDTLLQNLTALQGGDARDGSAN
jgi:hypothetical protein